MASSSLKKLVAESLQARRGEPRTWVAGDASTPLVPLARVGIAASAELAEYIAAAERREFREAVAGILEEGPMSQWALYPVRSPTSLLFKLSPANVTAFLAGLQPLAVDPDSTAVLVASWGRGKKTSTVASFLFNDVSSADEKRGDFVVEAASIRALLGAKAPARPRATAATRAMEHRYQRGVWLGQLLFSPDYWVDDPEDGTLRAMNDAAGLDVYRRERRLLATSPDLAAYWLLSHAILGDVAELDETLSLTHTARHPVVMDLRQRLRSGSAGPKVMEKLITKYRKELPEGFLEQVRIKARERVSPGGSKPRPGAGAQTAR